METATPNSSSPPATAAFTRSATIRASQRSYGKLIPASPWDRPFWPTWTATEKRTLSLQEKTDVCGYLVRRNKTPYRISHPLPSVLSDRDRIVPPHRGVFAFDKSLPGDIPSLARRSIDRLW